MNTMQEVPLLYPGDRLARDEFGGDSARVLAVVQERIASPEHVTFVARLRQAEGDKVS